MCSTRSPRCTPAPPGPPALVWAHKPTGHQARPLRPLSTRTSPATLTWSRPPPPRRLGEHPSLHPRTTGCPPMALAPRCLLPIQPHLHLGLLRTLAQCLCPLGRAPASWHSTWVARVAHHRLEHRGGHPMNGCGAAWRREAAEAAVRTPFGACALQEPLPLLALAGAHIG